MLAASRMCVNSYLVCLLIIFLLVVTLERELVYIFQVSLCHSDEFSIISSVLTMCREGNKITIQRKAEEGGLEPDFSDNSLFRTLFISC